MQRDTRGPVPAADRSTYAAARSVPRPLPLDERDPTDLRDDHPLIDLGRFNAHLDAFAWEPDPADRARRIVWFLSMVGPQVALRAIWARALKGERGYIRPSQFGRAQQCALAPEGPGGWRQRMANLPSAGGHQLQLLPLRAFFATERPDFLLIPPPRGMATPRGWAGLAAAHFRFLNARTDLPLDPGWAAWLWGRATREREAVALETYGLVDSAYRCRPDFRRLAADLSAGIAAGELRVASRERPAGEERAAA